MLLTYKFNTNNNSFYPLNYIPGRSNLLPETCTLGIEALFLPLQKVMIHTKIKNTHIIIKKTNRRLKSKTQKFSFLIYFLNN